MPPKNAAKGGGNQASKKTEQKKKEKVIEDKTFGLKNKKGGKQQKFIQQVQKQVVHGGNKSTRQMDKEKEDSKSKKDLKKQEILEINNLFKPVQQIVAKGVDPKSILCSYFKQGQCAKGTKCKFSHDLNIERRAEKRSAYCDVRDDKDEDTSEFWDEEMLKEVVEQKHGKEINKPSTLIICKFFLDSVEAGKYGWFWECPNGEKCIYRHALPSGYVLKKDRKRLDNKEEISLEDLIERERAALGLSTTKVTFETFLAWKKKKLKEREEKEKKDQDKKKSDYKSGKEGGISGREMFIFNPDLAVGENMEEGDAYFDFKNMKSEPEEGDEEEEEEMNIQYKEIDLSELRDEYITMESPSGSAAPAPDRLGQTQHKLANNIGVVNGISNGDDSSLSNCEGAVAIDEDLFGGDDEDLQDLEDQLEEMAVTS